LSVAVQALQTDSRRRLALLLEWAGRDLLPKRDSVNHSSSNQRSHSPEGADFLHSDSSRGDKPQALKTTPISKSTQPRYSHGPQCTEPLAVKHRASRVMERDRPIRHRDKITGWRSFVHFQNSNHRNHTPIQYAGRL